MFSIARHASAEPQEITIGTSTRVTFVARRLGKERRAEVIYDLPENAEVGFDVGGTVLQSFSTFRDVNIDTEIAERIRLVGPDGFTGDVFVRIIIDRPSGVSMPQSTVAHIKLV